MNFLLSLNRKYFFIFSSTIIIFFLLLILYKYLFLFTNNNIINNNIETNVDITEPKFSINSVNQKIMVTADEGNFLGNNQVLLKKNVKFQSNSFSIETDNVLFDRNKQTASSKTNSIFRSKNTKILSEGFNIYDNGKKIKFIGNAIVILK